MVTIRQPRGPDGSRGFKLRRVSVQGEVVEGQRGGEGEVPVVGKEVEVVSKGVVDRAGGDVPLTEALCKTLQI